MHQHAVEADRLEQPHAVLGPSLDGVALARVGGRAVAPRVERQQAEAPAEAVVDEPEVVPSEEPTAELQDDGRVLGARQLVVEPDTVVDLGVRHAFLFDGRPRGLVSPRSSPHGAS